MKRWPMCAAVAVAFVTACFGGAGSGGASSKSNAPTNAVPSPASGEPTAGDPVGLVSGSVYETAEDLRVSCPGVDLVMHRSYGSWSDRAGSLGVGWTHSYEWTVERVEDAVTVYVSGERGPSDVAREFAAPGPGGESLDAEGYAIRLSPDGRLWTMVSPDAVSYSFNSEGRLAAVSTWDGASVAVGRATPSGPVLRVVHSCGKSLEFEYEDGVRLSRVSVPGSPVSAEYSVEPRFGRRALVSAVRRDGARASTNLYRYVEVPSPGTRAASPSSRAVSRAGYASAPPPRPPVLSGKTDANGIETVFRYGRLNDAPLPRCFFTSLSGGLFHTELSFLDGSTAVRAPYAGGVAHTALAYDGKRRETERRTGAETRTLEYGAAGGVVMERVVNADTGAFVERATEYDSRHRPVSVGAAYCASPSRFTALAWDDRRGMPRRIVTPEGRVSEWTTNGHDVIVYGAGTNDARLVAQVFCTSNDRPYAVVSPDGGRTDLEYDGEGYLSRIEAEDLPPVTMARDVLGRVSSMTMPGPFGDRVTSFARNWRGKPLSVVYPDGTGETFEYEGNGRRVVRHVDALGREDVYKWVLGLPIHAGRVSGGVTNALFGVEHDRQLNVVAITDPLGRKAETYVLDANERVVAVTNVEGQVLARTYAVGDMVASESRFDGTAVSYAYGENANLASATYPDETLAFTYDGDGLRTSASNSVGVVTNEYDAATGWLMSSRGADGTEVSYIYSDGGEVTGVVSVAGTTRYALDKASRRTRIDSPAGTFGLGYCAWNGNVSAVTNGNGMVTAYAYDVMDRVTNIAWTAANGTALGGFSYEYDAAGRIASRGHTLGGVAFDRAYVYDGLDRLAADGGVAYTYDAAGNRMTRTENGETTTYTLGIGDRLSTWTGGSYTYNAAGCVTRIERDGRPTLNLTWNGQYQLVSVSTNGVFAEGYAYDALGRRVSTTTQEGAVRHVYDDNWQCLADIDENGNVLRSYVWGDGIDKLLAIKIGGNTYYPLTDIQGTVWGYVDSANNVVARWNYDAWGNVLSESCAVPSLASVRYRFQGREWAKATGLINFRFRWYDPVTGRWISKDPIGLGGGLNLYLVCKCNPLISTDAFGLVNMNLFPRNEAIHNYANRHNPNDVFSVGVHGNANGIYYTPPGTGQSGSISASTLANMIRSDSGYHGQPVQLDSCNVGNGQYPQQLSNLLGVEVRAPTQFAWYYPSGSVVYAGMTATGGINTNASGELRSFSPSIGSRIMSFVNAIFGRNTR